MSSGKVAVFAGSFDPITFGHIDVIKKASSIFDSVVVLIADNPKKKYVFTKIRRKEHIDNCDLPKNVFCQIWGGLVVDYLEWKQKYCDKVVLVRGIRDADDVFAELKLADINKSIGGFDTIFFHTENHLRFVSSSLVKELALSDRDVKEYMPMHIISDFNMALRGQ